MQYRCETTNISNIYFPSSQLEKCIRQNPKMETFLRCFLFLSSSRRTSVTSTLGYRVVRIGFTIKTNLSSRGYTAMLSFRLYYSFPEFPHCEREKSFPWHTPAVQGMCSTVFYSFISHTYASFPSWRGFADILLIKILQAKNFQCECNENATSFSGILAQSGYETQWHFACFAGKYMTL